MLKIKDNVDLKVLEQYGFKFVEEEYKGKYVIRKKVYKRKYLSYSRYESEKTLVTVHIFDNRKITHSTFKGWDNLLFDLIKADLVEKVVE